MAYNNDTTTCANQVMSDPFCSLLQALELHVDDLVRKPEFHVFMKLPLELRYQIYEEYFLADTKSVSCRSWPHLTIDHDQQFRLHHLMDSAPFLPNLCLVSRALRAEVTSFLVRSTTFDMAKLPAMKTFFKTLDRPRSRRDFDWTAYVRKLVLRDTNSCSSVCLGLDFGGASPQARLGQEDTAYACQSLSRFSGVRVLELGFHAPMVNASGDLWTLDLQATAIDPFLHGVDLLQIKALPQLQLIKLTGSSGSQSALDSETILRDDKMEHLEGVVKLGQQIKDMFDGEGRQVDVRVRLLWSDQCDERIL
ncbi:hypothetical protein P153DRAFT_428261 [Dothidotthia symphoricarpi CBS 119687]|uniref:2EXR domain-containing protein n=1 Tax=Dothidotthia symphoricarpi CBS 119687 TaxID=1392245 RepID=A0A6A6AMM7_9PLEO|nr:uncharacterized protein P153DRAFT_428261 [Dothidotthia symphoricarpi CBS 119687]KAF2133232.1 hypothetical protein P153DRAFT_428261 [Dothidotthia symphoricarpi CBS 119687]